MTPEREYFTKRGDLNKCNEPAHTKFFGRLMLSFRLGTDGRCSLTSNGYLQTHWIHLGRLETMDGLTIYELVLWRLYFVAAWVK